jgi:hypothetical protein
MPDLFCGILSRDMAGICLNDDHSHRIDPNWHETVRTGIDGLDPFG